MQRLVAVLTAVAVAVSLAAAPNAAGSVTQFELLIDGTYDANLRNGAVPRWSTVSAGSRDDAPLTATGSATALLSHDAAAAPFDAGGAEVSARNRSIPRNLAATGASAYDVPARLNEVAHVYSLGVGEVRCPAQTEWEAYYGSAFAWGSTNLRDDYTTLAPFICDGASNVGSSSVPLWQQAAGVWVLVHEAFHLRHWRFRRNEAKVACQAIVYFRDGAMRLGASEEEAEELYPYALALHIRQTELFSWYRDKQCRAPLWVPPIP